MIGPARILALVLAIFWIGGCAGNPGSRDAESVNPALEEARRKGLVPAERRQPNYPRRAALAGVQGCVTVSFDVMPDGRTDNYEVLDSKPQGVFVKEALLALRDWRFPEREEPIRTQQKIEFQLMGYPERERPNCELNPDLPEVYWVKGAR